MVSYEGNLYVDPSTDNTGTPYQSWRLYRRVKSSSSVGPINGMEKVKLDNVNSICIVRKMIILK